MRRRAPARLGARCVAASLREKKLWTCVSVLLCSKGRAHGFQLFCCWRQRVLPAAWLGRLLARVASQAIPKEEGSALRANAQWPMRARAKRSPLQSLIEGAKRAQPNAMRRLRQGNVATSMRDDARAQRSHLNNVRCDTYGHTRASPCGFHVLTSAIFAC